MNRRHPRKRLCESVLTPIQLESGKRRVWTQPYVAKLLFYKTLFVHPINLTIY